LRFSRLLRRAVGTCAPGHKGSPEASCTSPLSTPPHPFVPVVRACIGHDRDDLWRGRKRQARGQSSRREVITAAAECTATLLWTEIASPMSDRPGKDDAAPGRGTAESGSSGGRAGRDDPSSGRAHRAIGHLGGSAAPTSRFGTYPGGTAEGPTVVSRGWVVVGALGRSRRRRPPTVVVPRPAAWSQALRSCELQEEVE